MALPQCTAVSQLSAGESLSSFQIVLKPREGFRPDLRYSGAQILVLEIRVRRRQLHYLDGLFDEVRSD